MNLWLKKISLLPFAGIIYLLGQYLRGLWFQHLAVFDYFLNPCRYSVDGAGVFCNSPYLETGFTLIAAGEMLAIVGIIILFANERGWRAWLKFSYFFVPIAAFIVIFLSPMPLFPIVPPVSREVVTFVLGYVYILITLVIVAACHLISLRHSARAS